jgi:hypothetical protein
MELFLKRGDNRCMYGVPAYANTGKDRRRHRRDALSASLTTLWGESAGQEDLVQAKLLDISPQGARFRVQVRIPAGSWFMFNYQKENIHGRGTVRHCRLVKGMFEVGVEFPNGTGWRPKETVVSSAVEKLRAALGPVPSQVPPTIEVCPLTTPS